MDAFFDKADTVMGYILIGVLVLIPISLLLYGAVILIRKIIRNIRCACGDHYDSGGCSCYNCGKQLREHKYIYKSVTYPSYRGHYGCAYCGRPITPEERRIGCRRGHIGLMQGCKCTYCGKEEHGRIQNCRCTHCGKEVHQFKVIDTIFRERRNYGVTSVDMVCKVCGLERHYSYKF